MKFFIPALAILLFSCSKIPDMAPPPNPPGGGGNGGGGSTPVTLGIQKDIFGSTRHDFAGILEANNNRLFFATYNTNTSNYEYYAGDENDTSYLLIPYSNPNSFSIHNAKPALKPNGDIVCILKLGNFVGADSVFTLINRPHTNNWQVVKREIQNSFWDKYYFNQALFIFSTGSGRLVLTGQNKAAVSDDDGLTWRETFNLPAGFTNNSGMTSSVSGTRNFVTSGNEILYSDNNFETASLVAVGPMDFLYINNKPLKLADQRLVLQYNMPSRTFYQSLNNGQTWSLMPLADPVDSLFEFSSSYFCYVDGNTIRARARYKPCDAFFTVDINPVNKFLFYPNTRPTTCPTTNTDVLIQSAQRPDKRMYYAISAPIGVLTYFGIKRDY